MVVPATRITGLRAHCYSCRECRRISGYAKHTFSALLFRVSKKTGATIPFQTAAVPQFASTASKGTKRRNNNAAGHLRSLKIEIRDTSRQLRRIKRGYKTGNIETHRLTSTTGYSRNSFVYPNKRLFADTWRDTIVANRSRMRTLPPYTAEL